MDLATLDTRKGAELGFSVELLHPKTGAPTGARVTVRGADSDIYEEKFRELQRQRLGTLARQRSARLDPDQIEADSIVLLAAVTAGWDGIEENGAAVQFNEAAAQALYRRFPWIREQVDAAVHERGNFLPPGATN